MAIPRLPGDVIAQIISLTTPQDACTMSSVSTNFRSIADSDLVWANFLPPGCENLIPHISTKKAIYRHLCHHSVLIDGQNVSWSLDARSGKKCFMFGSRELWITWGHDQRYWNGLMSQNPGLVKWLSSGSCGGFTSREGSKRACCRPRRPTRRTSSSGFEDYKSGFHRPAASRVSVESDERGQWPNVILDPREGEPRLAIERGDGWLEIEMGEFYNENGDDGTLVCSLKEVDDYTEKGGLVVEGIELRPKET